MKDVIEKKDWNKLRFLYFGSVLNVLFRGLVIECDVLYVFLDFFIELNVEDVYSFVKVFL